MTQLLTHAFTQLRRTRTTSAITVAVLTLGLTVGSTFLDVSSAHAQDKDDKNKTTEKKDDSPDDDVSRYNCGNAKGRFYVNFRPDVELKDLVDWAMGFSCKSFVYASSVGSRSAKVTIMTPKRLNAREAWRIFLTALQSMNLTVVPKGSVLEIVEQSKAKRKPLPLYIKGRPSSSDQIVRVVLRPDHLSIGDLTTILQELKSADGEVKGVPNAGIIVVTDFGSHVSKMAALMLDVDRPVVGERLYMIKVEHADANELVTKLQEILGTKENKAPKSKPSRSSRAKKSKLAKSKAASSVANDAIASAIPSKITADERINAIIVLGSKPAYKRVKALVKRLDFALPSTSSGRIHVYPLEHADSEEMSQTLTAVISGIQQSSSRPGPAGRPRTQTRTPTGTNAGSTASSFEGDVRVSHDKPTNSLVVVASVADFNSLLRVIRILDSARRQVYIEATIVEVSVVNSRDVGVSFHGGTVEDDTGSIILGGVQHSQLSSLNVATLGASTGLIGGVLGPLLEGAEQFLGTSIPSFGVLFQALATSGNVNILSSPHIFTTDNEEAEISVGQNIPYQSAAIGLGGLGGAGGGLVPGTSVQRQDVALTLKITPHINVGGMVRLEIDLEISDVADRNFENLGPSWSKRTIKDTVIVRDQQPVVIGGLMQDRSTTNESKVPILGDIPLLGYLFKYKTKSKEKRNLLVMLTPHVVTDQLDIDRIVERRTREQAEFVRSFSTFDGMKYRPDIDYRRKRGVLEAINRAAYLVEVETAELAELEKRRVTFPDGPIDYIGDDSRDDEDGEGGEPKATDESEKGE